MSSHPTHPSVVIRSARGSDAEELDRLAALDSAAALTGAVLVAEVEDRIVAALDADSGRVIADPFVGTHDLLGLLRYRATPASRPRRLNRLGWGHAPARAV